MTFFKKIKKLYFFIIDTLLNFIQNSDVIYVVDDFNWSIKHDGESICNSIKSKIRMRTTTSHLAPKGTIIHFGDIYTFFTKRGLKKIHKENPIVLTWFHIVENDIGFKYFEEYKDRISYLHLSNNLSRETILKKGLCPKKIFFAPIPVNTKVFSKKSTIRETKRELNIPLNKVVIGSFQKDGNGWGEGNDPKLVKGPDIFCDLVEKLSEDIDLHILLSGPARGYVKNRLEKKKIPYSHYFFDDPNKVSELYEALDLYLMTSRVEGGPKSFTESWAMEVPYAGTPVGMVVDYGKDGENFIQIDINNIDESAEKIKNFISTNENHKKVLTNNALHDLQDLTLEAVSEKYLNLYKSLIK